MPSFPAGRLDQIVAFERRRMVDDAHGNVQADWVALFTRFCNVKPSAGREQLEAGRLESTFRAVVKVRRDSLTSTIQAGDRVVFQRAPYLGLTANIRSIVPLPDRAFLDLVVEQGVAD
jgi:head-tail adaptor